MVLPEHRPPWASTTRCWRATPGNMSAKSFACWPNRCLPSASCSPLSPYPTRSMDTGAARPGRWKPPVSCGCRFGKIVFTRNVLRCCYSWAPGCCFFYAISKMSATRSGSTPLFSAVFSSRWGPLCLPACFTSRQPASGCAWRIFRFTSGPWVGGWSVH